MLERLKVDLLYNLKEFREGLLFLCDCGSGVKVHACPVMTAAPVLKPVFASQDMPAALTLEKVYTYRIFGFFTFLMNQ